MPPSIWNLLHPVSFIRHNALYQGVFGGRRGWQFVAVVVFGAKLIRKVVGRQPEYLGIEKLRAGQSVTITSIPPASRRERRAARRSADG